jgi:hypothetical protein
VDFQLSSPVIPSLCDAICVHVLLPPCHQVPSEKTLFVPVRRVLIFILILQPPIMTSWWFLDRVPFWRKTGISGGTKDCNYQNSDILPETQTVLLLYNLGQPYQLISNYAVPQLGATEVLVRTRAIGLNHIDWKAPYVYNF